MAASTHMMILAVLGMTLAVTGVQSALMCYSCPEGCDYFYFHRLELCAEDKDSCIRITKEDGATVRGCSQKTSCTLESLIVDGVSSLLNVITDNNKQDASCCESWLCNADDPRWIGILVPVLFLVLILVTFLSCIGCIIKLCCCICRK